MHKQHFISGLPRSGSTLLSLLLRQNPSFIAGMTSPVGHLFNSVLTETSMRHEDAIFINNDVRQRLLYSVFTSYYPDVPKNNTAFDTNRMWTTKLSAIDKLFPQAKVICCVRNPGWILDSIEKLVRGNPYELSGIFNFEPGGTVYSRADGLSSPNGMLGFAFNALKEAVFSPNANKLLLLRYETLVKSPMQSLEAVHQFIDEPMFDYNPNKIDSCHEMEEFDRRLGTPGLHYVKNRVEAKTRQSLLPPDLFNRHQQEIFWESPQALPADITLV